MTRAQKARMYWRLTQAEKRLTERKEKLRQELIDAGSFQADGFSVEVSEKRRERLASIQEFCESIGRKTLEKKGLIMEIKYPQVIVRKA